MDYEPFRVSYTAGQPYVGATLSMYPPPGKSNMGNFIAWDGKTGKIVWSLPEQFSVWSGALATAGGVVFYGTLEGYLKAVDAKTGKELYKFKTPSGIIGNVTTYEHGGKQYVAHRSCRRPDGSHRRPGRRRRLCRLEELHIARRPAHGVCTALKPNGRSARCCSRSRIYPRSGAITVPVGERRRGGVSGC
jgi:hypothetical protein